MIQGFGICLMQGGEEKKLNSFQCILKELCSTAEAGSPQ